VVRQRAARAPLRHPRRASWSRRSSRGLHDRPRLTRRPLGEPTRASSARPGSAR
jgi:hypothetical protein